MNCNTHNCHHHHHPHRPPSTMSSALHLGPEYYEETPRRYFTLGVLCCCISGFVFFVGIILMVSCWIFCKMILIMSLIIFFRSLVPLPLFLKQSTLLVLYFSCSVAFSSLWVSLLLECITRAKINDATQLSLSMPRTSTPAVWPVPRAEVCTRPTSTSSTKSTIVLTLCTL